LEWKWAILTKRAAVYNAAGLFGLMGEIQSACA